MKKSKKNKRKSFCRTLIFGSITILLILVTTILIVFFGTPIGYLVSNKNINEYESKLADIDFSLFERSKIKYNFKDSTYYRVYTYKKQPLLYFSIECYKDKCRNGYEFNYIEGTNALAILGNRIRESKLSDFHDNYGYNRFGILLLEPIDTLNNLGVNKDKFMNNEDIENLPIFKVTFQMNVESFDSDEVYNGFVTINNYLKSKKYSPVYLEASVYLMDGETNKVITNITEDALKDKESFNTASMLSYNDFEVIDNSEICAQALEKFYEDKNNEYYFSCIKSNSILIKTSEGKKYMIKEALKQNIITIDELLHRDLDIYIQKKN